MNRPAMVTAKDIRAACSHRKEEKQPCFVCDEHEAITHKHHVYPLKSLVNIFETRNLYPQCKFPKVSEPPTVWLCPNCHAYAHLFYLDYPTLEASDLPDTHRYMQWLVMRMGFDYLKQELDKIYGNIDN